MRQFSTIKHITIALGLILASSAVLLNAPESTASAACQVPSPSYGADTLTVNVPATGTYSIWTRLQISSASANSFMLQVDGSSCYTVGGNARLPLNTWTWVNYQNGATSTPLTQTLSAGTHNLTLIGSAPNVAVDRILISADPTCVPTGSGDNCVTNTVPPPSVSFAAPANNATVSGSQVTISVNASTAANVNIAKVVVSVDGQTLATDTNAPYQNVWDTIKSMNGQHTLSVVATDVLGQSSSATENATVANVVGCASAPSVPGGLQANSVGINSVSLMWNPSTAPTNCVLGGYTVFRNGQQIAQSNGNSYDDTTVSESTQYSYTVVAHDTSTPSKTSAPSVPLAVTTLTAPDTTSPSVPSNLHTTADTTSQVTLGWSPSIDNPGGSGLAGYYVIRDGVTISKLITINSYADINVSPNSTYTYTVLAVDKAGNASSQSVSALVTTPNPVDNQRPSTPTGVVATTDSSSQITISWNKSTDNIGVKGYHVYRNGTSNPIANTTDTSYGDTDLSAITTYSYTVVAYDGAGNTSISSAIVKATTLTLVPPKNDSLTIYGDVYDPGAEQFVAGVHIQSDDVHTTTNEEGNYIMRGLKPNVYLVYDYTHTGYLRTHLFQKHAAGKHAQYTYIIKSPKNDCKGEK